MAQNITIKQKQADGSYLELYPRTSTSQVDGFDTFTSETITLIPYVTTTAATVYKNGHEAKASFQFVISGGEWVGEQKLGTLPYPAKYVRYGVAWSAATNKAVSIYVSGNEIYMQSNTPLLKNDIIRGGIDYFI